MSHTLAEIYLAFDIKISLYAIYFMRKFNNSILHLILPSCSKASCFVCVRVSISTQYRVHFPLSFEALARFPMHCRPPVSIESARLPSKWEFSAPDLYKELARFLSTNCRPPILHKALARFPTNHQPLILKASA